MTKNELLNTIQTLNLRNDDVIRIKLTEEGKEECLMYRLCSKKGIDLETINLKFRGACFHEIYINRYGAVKKSSTVGGYSYRLCRIYIYNENERYEDFLEAEYIESIEVLTNTKRRRKNEWLAIENY